MDITNTTAYILDLDQPRPLDLTAPYEMPQGRTSPYTQARVLVDPDGTVRAYDPQSGTYTLAHDLSEAEQERARAEAGVQS